MVSLDSLVKPLLRGPLYLNPTAKGNSLMSLIQGFATHAAGAELLPYKYDPGDIKPNEVEITISHCGICRSDLHMVDNDWGISQYPLIPGHEIIGKITELGAPYWD